MFPASQTLFDTVLIRDFIKIELPSKLPRVPLLMCLVCKLAEPWFPFSGPGAETHKNGAAEGSQTMSGQHCD